MQLERQYQTSFRLMVLLVLLLVGFLSYKSLGFPYLSYDESGQFFMSKGLNHHSSPFSEFGSLADALENNRHYNLDPGGFTVLLYYWSKISNDCRWLRALPLLFFLAFLYYAYNILELSIKSKGLSVLGCSFLLLSGDITYQLSFLRAYSMEMCGTMASLYYLMVWHRSLNKDRLLKLGLLIAFFCTSRYSFWLTAFILGIVILYLIGKQKKKISTVVQNISIFAAPIFIICLAIFFCMTIYQNAGASNIGYSTYLSTVPSAFKSHLSCAFYLMILFAVCQYRWLRKHMDIPIMLAIGVAALAFVLSVLNKFPWDGRKDISVTILLYLGIWLSVMQIVIIKMKGREKLQNSVSVSLLFLVVAIGIYKRNKEVDFRLHDHFLAFMESHPKGKIFVNWTLSPDLRYLYEFGAFKNRIKCDGYPQRFVLGNRMWHTFNENKGNIKVLDLNQSNCEYYYTNNSSPMKGWRLLSEYNVIFERK